MSHTNSTTNYGLPQFLTTDKPFWLTDINGAFSDIDTAIKNAKDAGDNAQSDATQALSDAGDALTAASGAGSKADGALASIADTYSAASTYAIGDLVIYNSLLYKNTTAIITPEAWDGTHWTRTTIEDELDTLNNAVDDILNPDTTSISIISSRTDVNNWNQGSVTVPKSNSINISFIFENTGNTNPQITHTISLSNGKTLTSFNVITLKTTGERSFSGTYDNGYLKWNQGLPQGTYLVIGTAFYS